MIRQILSGLFLGFLMLVGAFIFGATIPIRSRDGDEVSFLLTRNLVIGAVLGAVSAVGIQRCWGRQYDGFLLMAIAGVVYVSFIVANLGWH
jgi:hypothetical protein